MKKLLEGQDFVIRWLPFPNCKVDGAIMRHPDGIAQIYINSRVSQERQLAALQHEMEHLYKDDLYSDEPREMIEGRMNDRRK